MVFATGGECQRGTAHRVWGRGCRRHPAAVPRTPLGHGRRPRSPLPAPFSWLAADCEKLWAPLCRHLRPLLNSSRDGRGARGAACSSGPDRGLCAPGWLPGTRDAGRLRRERRHGPFPSRHTLEPACRSVAGASESPVRSAPDKGAAGPRGVPAHGAGATRGALPPRSPRRCARCTWGRSGRGRQQVTLPGRVARIPAGHEGAPASGALMPRAVFRSPLRPAA